MFKGEACFALPKENDPLDLNVDKVSLLHFFVKI